MNVMGMGSLAGGYVSRFSAYGQSSIVAFQALGDISPGQELVQCQQRLLTQRLGWGGAALAGAKVPFSKHRSIAQRGKVYGKGSCICISIPKLQA